MIILVVLLILIIVILWKIYFNKVEHLNTKINTNVLGYTSIDAPYTKPRIITNLLTEVECRKIIDFCIDSKLNKNIVHIAPVKLKYRQEYILSKNDPLVKKLVQQLALDLYIPFENAEDVQVVRYIPNQSTKPLVDACCNSINDTCKEYITTGGQRIVTCIVYLNSDFTGGETYFDKLDIKFKPGIGDGVAFFNVAQNINRCHPAAEHSSLVIGNGEKWVLKVRFRERKNTLFRETIS